MRSARNRHSASAQHSCSRLFPAWLSPTSSWAWFGRGASPRRSIRFAHSTIFRTDFVTPWRDLFDGQLISILHMPRSYVPTLLAMQLSELMLALGLCGFAGTVIAVGRSGIDWRQRASLLAIVLAVSLPILMTIITLPYIFNGIRHLLFVVPPIAVLRRPGWRLDCAPSCDVRPRCDHGRRHRTRRRHNFTDRRHDQAAPLRVPDFNHFVGGAKGARPLFMLDYWGLSLTQASRGLIALLAQHHEAPPDGPWKVAVCGPDRRSG